MNLNLQAVLVRVGFHMCSQTETDKQTTDEVQLQKMAGENAGRYVKQYFSKEALKPINTVKSAWTTAVNHITLPWDGGWRMCPSKNYEKFESIKAEYSKLFLEAKQDLIDFLPQHKDEAKTRLGAMYDEATFPDAASMERDICFEIGLQPLPASDAVARLSSLAPEFQDAIRASTDARVVRAREEARDDIMRRIMEPVGRLATQLAKPDGKLVDSVLEKLRAICEIAPTLDLDGDPGLNALIEQCKTDLAGVDLEALRTNKDERKIAADKAAALLASFSKAGTRAIA